MEQKNNKKNFFAFKKKANDVPVEKKEKPKSAVKKNRAPSQLGKPRTKIGKPSESAPKRERKDSTVEIKEISKKKNKPNAELNELSSFVAIQNQDKPTSAKPNKQRSKKKETSENKPTANKPTEKKTGTVKKNKPVANKVSATVEQSKSESAKSEIATAEIVKEGKSSPKRQGKPAVKVIFLGGVGEIGKNMTAIECGDDIIVIDAGIIFPTEEMPGIDLVVPDISYLLENRHKVRCVLLTHGHEDHIGGVPYLLKELNVPIVGTKLTLALVDNKLREHKINDAKEIVVSPGENLQWGCFNVEFINVNHSIAGALALCIHTPQGVVYHSGDFKIDFTPVAGEPTDLTKISEIGSKGVLLYLGESTNIERNGFTMSETVVGTTLDRLFNENIGKRIIIATFASNVHRLQQIIDLAVKYKRKVALNGRSMLNVVEAAEKIGEISIPEGILMDVAKTKNLMDGELVIVSTGSQGEPMSALTRMANGENPLVTVGSNDTIIISASPIPGNERGIYGVINKLYQRGADVVYESLENIHVSGHACKEEHKILHTLLKPKFFIPVHGEYRHLKKHAQLATSLGMKESHIMLAEVGNCIELTSKTIKRLPDVVAGSRLIDGDGIEDEKTSVVMQDRRQIAAEGLFIVAVVVSGGEVIGEPTINSRGFVFDFHHDYNKEMREVIDKAIQGYDLNIGSIDELKRAIKKALRNYLMKKTKQSPMIVPVVVEL